MKLAVKGLVKYICGLILVCLLVFLPAGTFNYTCGWLFVGLLFVPILILGTVLLIKAPKLLEKRLDGKEKEGEQKSVVAFSAIMFLCGFVIAGLDHRFGWSHVPTIVVVIASVLFAVAYILYAEVMRENAYLSRTVEVQEGQKVIDTGLYGIVRHPMYAVTVLLFLMIPLILGSFYAFLIFVFYPFILAKRIKNEEEFLTKNLPGYSEYKKKVKYKMIPLIF